MVRRSRRRPGLWIGLFLGCGNTPPPAPPIAHHTTPAAPPAPVVDARCTGNLSPHREALVRGRPTEIAAFGKQATYHGQSHDHFDDGSTAIVLSLDVFGEPWLPDARDRAFHAFGDHCVRIVDSGDARLVLDVALQPAHVYDPERCQMACCVTEAQRQPAPDGSIECCFCPDDPTP
jgi:hypothetical protein